MISNKVANLFSPKKARPRPQKSQKEPNTSFKANSHKTCVIKHKIDIKTCQKHQYNYNTIQSLAFSFFFRSNYTVLHLFLINNIDDF